MYYVMRHQSDCGTCLTKEGLIHPMHAILPQAVLPYISQHPDLLLVDARGLRCPMPVLRLGKAVREAPDITAFLLLATDDSARLDVPAFCSEKSWQYQLLSDDQGLIIFRVQTQ
jgi:tRNA 2-thiouridine synthesizing protein A